MNYPLSTKTNSADVASGLSPKGGPSPDTRLRKSVLTWTVLGWQNYSRVVTSNTVLQPMNVRIYWYIVYTFESYASPLLFSQGKGLAWPDPSVIDGQTSTRCPSPSGGHQHPCPVKGTPSIIKEWSAKSFLLFLPPSLVSRARCPDWTDRPSLTSVLTLRLAH